MGDGEEFEKALAQFQHEPGPRARISILAAFKAQRHRARRARRVPLLAATAVFLMTAALSFMAGRWSVARNVSHIPNVDGAVTSESIDWAVAESDIL